MFIITKKDNRGRKIMRNFKNYVILSVVLIIAMLVIMSQGVQASPQLIFGNNTTSGGTVVGDTTGTTTTPSTTLTPTTAPQTTTVPSTTITTTTKDPAPTTTPAVNITNTTSPTTTRSANLPQTGENDIYIVSAIGAVALILGGIAYVKSRKYDM